MSNPAGTLRIRNVAVWLLFGQVPFLRENYVATMYFRYVMCKSLWQRIFQRFCYVRYGLDANVKAQT